MYIIRSFNNGEEKHGNLYSVMGVKHELVISVSYMPGKGSWEKEIFRL